MKCPLFTIGRTDVQLGVESDYGECLREMCAWWEKKGGACSMEVIARFITGIASNVANIASKTPLGGRA